MTYPTELIAKANYEIRIFDRVAMDTGAELLAEVVRLRAIIESTPNENKAAPLITSPYPTNKGRINEPGHALAYLTECTLATVCDLAGKKSRSSSEFNRQKSMAQQAVNWMREMGVDFKTTRAEDVVRLGGSVDEWAATFFPKK